MMVLPRMGFDSIMPAFQANIGQAWLGLGILALAGCILAGWFNALGHPLIYYPVVASLSLMIGLWPFKEPRLGRRVFIAFVGSIGACVVLVVVGLAIEHMKLGGWDEGGPVLGGAVIVVLLGLPVMILAMIVAAIAPRLRRLG
jgi:hypothetical protein